MRKTRAFDHFRLSLGTFLVAGFLLPASAQANPKRKAISHNGDIIPWTDPGKSAPSAAVRFEVFGNSGEDGSPAEELQAVALNLAKGKESCAAADAQSVAGQVAPTLGEKQALAVYSPCMEKGKTPDSAAWLKRVAQKHPGKPVMMRVEGTEEFLRLVRSLRKDPKTAGSVARLSVSLDRHLSTAEYGELERLTRANPNLKAHLIARGGAKRARSWFPGMTYSESRSQEESSWRKLLEPDLRDVQEKLNRDRVARKRNTINEDGISGDETTGAILAFQRDHGLERTGKLDAETISKILTGKAAAKPPSSAVVARGIPLPEKKPEQARKAKTIPPLPVKRPEQAPEAGKTPPLPVEAVRTARKAATSPRLPVKVPGQAGGAANKVEPPIAKIDGRRYRVYKAKGSAYFKYGQNTAAKRRMEGGQKDRFGKPLQTLQCYLAGNCSYVSVAMDKRLRLPSTTKLRIPELERKYGRKIEFRVVDTGGAFTGKGHKRVDICVDTEKQSYSSALNGPMTLLFER